ncbi:MAG: hypothetical protein IIC72_10860 [Acidobacteria bacterium]|nr:hypothetical protein [Acidobacteriota bacterium]
MAMMSHGQADRLRMAANPYLIGINIPGSTGDFSMLLSKNAVTGGTCFGDSGDPSSSVTTSS